MVVSVSEMSRSNYVVLIVVSMCIILLESEVSMLYVVRAVIGIELLIKADL